MFFSTTATMDKSTTSIYSTTSSLIISCDQLLGNLSIHYIHNWPLQSFSQDYYIVSHTTYIVCVYFIHKWRDPQFKVDFERQYFFGKLFMEILFTLGSFCQKSAKRKSPKVYSLYLVLTSGLGFELWLYVE